MKPIPIIATALFALSLSSCLGVKNLESMDRNTERLANSFEKDHKHFEALDQNTDRLAKNMDDYGKNFQAMDENTKRLAMELEHDRKYLEVLTLQLTKMSEAIQALNTLGQTTVHSVLNQLFRSGENGSSAPAPAGETSDLEDLLQEEPKPELTPEENDCELSPC